MPTTALTKKDITLLETVAQSARHTIISMLKQSQSGHPGGSLSCIDYLTVLYTKILSQTGEPIVVSNGHISPAVYAILAEMGYLSKKDVIRGFRRFGFPYEGHVTRHVPGIWFGTGPLGAGASAASGFALAEKMKKSGKYVYALVGDGESQEGQIYEMMNFASKYALDNFIVFLDYNKVQLTDSLDEIMPIHPAKQWAAAGWTVIDVDGHDVPSIWKALTQAKKSKEKPVLLVGHTIMGKGVDFMEDTGKKYQADWHGKAPTAEQAEKALEQLTLSPKQETLLEEMKKTISWKPKKNTFTELLQPVKVHTGKPIRYEADTMVDCRTAYGNALLDLAKKNKHIIAMTADLAGSVKTQGVKDALPNQHIEVGVAEQHMVSCAGGMSFDGFIPFCSTFGAFMTSRAKDQARVNDINQANVKMVATHCGLSVGEDGPTHQAIDDIGSMLGLFNTLVLEPADANQCDRMIRFIASHYGNVYMRMGRHKLPVLTKENGDLFFDETYTYRYGRCDVLRKGSDITIAASGSVVSEALKAVESLQGRVSAELIILSSPKQFDNTLFNSIKKTGHLLVVEDHNPYSGYGSQLLQAIQKRGLSLSSFKTLGVEKYQLSGTYEKLYASAGIDASSIKKAILSQRKKAKN